MFEVYVCFKALVLHLEDVVNGSSKELFGKRVKILFVTIYKKLYLPRSCVFADAFVERLALKISRNFRFWFWFDDDVVGTYFFLDQEIEHLLALLLYFRTVRLLDSWIQIFWYFHVTRSVLFSLLVNLINNHLKLRFNHVLLFFKIRNQMRFRLPNFNNLKNWFYRNFLFSCYFIFCNNFFSHASNFCRNTVILQYLC